ncbi:MAG: hypothetical protein ACI8PZ_007528 [Myxococcota bacterium]|jgi:hypothetical protein
MLMLTLLATTSFAQEDPVFVAPEVVEEPAAEEPEGLLSAELGGNVTTGNSAFYTISSTVNGSYRWDKSRLGLIGGLLVGKGIPDTDGSGAIGKKERRIGYVQNARRYYADARHDYFLGERDSLYVLAGAFIDPFAGYDIRAHEQIGYSRTLVTTDDTTLVVEIGADLAQEDYVDGVDPGYRDVLAARVMLGLTHNFSDSVGIGETIEVYENVLDPVDLRLLNTFFLTASVSEKVAFKLSHNLLFDNQPVDGFQPLDQTTLVTLVATLL